MDRRRDRAESFERLMIEPAQCLRRERVGAPFAAFAFRA
jgi:hypothetical protein